MYNQLLVSTDFFLQSCRQTVTYTMDSIWFKCATFLVYSVTGGYEELFCMVLNPGTFFDTDVKWVVIKCQFTINCQRC